MRILFDTNVIIKREDYEIIEEDLNELLSIINKLNFNILYHPKSIEDLKNDKDKTRREIVIAKLKTYNSLEKTPDPSKDKNFLSTTGPSTKKNEIIDNAILYALYKNAVNLLITEDRGIHKKALRLGVQDRVLTVLDAIELIEKYLPVEKVKLPPALKETFVYNLDIKDPIFDSLKQEYSNPPFEEWFEKISKQGRKGWVSYLSDGSIGALLIYKLNENEVIPTNPPQPEKSRLKISTMKVSRVGYKIGELLIKLSIDLAIDNNLSEIYLTHYTKKNDRLVDLISEFSFKHIGRIENGEDIYLKKILVKQIDLKSFLPKEISRLFYPNFYDGKSVNIFIIPIKPIFHEKLFTDYRKQTTILEYAGEFIVEGNTIQKAYICNANTKKIKSGDLVLFYRSGDHQAITSIGIVEEIHYNQRDANSVSNLVGKRTVYSLKEIEEITQKNTLVLLFNFHFHFKKPISKDYLLNNKVLKRIPQSISKIEHDKYLLIKKKGGIDERFTFN